MADNFYPKDRDFRAQAADEVSGVLYPRMKVVWGADNTCTDTSAAAPLPVNIATTSTVIIGDVAEGVRATTTNAVSGFHRVAAGSGDAVNVKSTPGRLYGWSFQNVAATPRFVKLHNTAGTPTAGSGVVRTIGIPANGNASLWLNAGHFFSTGIGMTIVTGAADADATGATAGDVVGELWYA